MKLVGFALAIFLAAALSAQFGLWPASTMLERAYFTVTGAAIYAALSRLWEV